MQHRTICGTLFLGLATLIPLAAQDGAAIYKDHCAMCHDRSAETRAPAPTALRQMSPENVVSALVSGLMKEQGASLSAAQKATVAEFLTGKKMGQAAPEASHQHVSAVEPALLAQWPFLEWLGRRPEQLTLSETPQRPAWMPRRSRA